jgi:hypothetical protein
MADAPLVFISYNHADEAWKERLRQQLQVLSLQGDLALWDDRDIAIGDDRRPAIDEALSHARIAVLLISASFLTSDFIRGVEVSRLLQRRQADGLRVIPLIVKPCAWREVPWLAEIACHPRDGQPLSGLSEHAAESALVELAQAIKKLLDSSPKPAPPAASRPTAARGASMPSMPPRVTTPARTSEAGPVRVLFLAANPADGARLALGEEARAIEAQIRASEHRDVLHFETRWAVRIEDLLFAINERAPTILHFSGHGASDGLWLQGESDAPEPVSGQDLADALRAAPPVPRLVLLNACYSEAQARALVEVVDCAVGVPALITDRTARLFAAQFYSALGFGKSVQKAFDQASVLLRVKGAGGGEGAAPHLLARAGVDPARLVLVAPERP